MGRTIAVPKPRRRARRLAVVIGVPIALLLLAPAAMAAKPANPVCSITGINFPNPADNASGDAACDSQVCVYVGGTVSYTGSVSSGTPPYTTTWQFGGGNPFEVSGSIAASGGTDTQSTAYYAEGPYSTSFSARDSSGKNGRSCSADSRSVRVINPGGTGGGDVSINSTSANGAPQVDQVPEQPLDSTPGYTVIGINDLGIGVGQLVKGHIPIPRIIDIR